MTYVTCHIMTQPSSSLFESLTRPTWTARRDCNVPICWLQDERLAQRCQTEWPFGGDQTRSVPSKWINMRQLCRNDSNYKTTYIPYIRYILAWNNSFKDASMRDLQTMLRAAGECPPARTSRMLPCKKKPVPKKHVRKIKFSGWPNLTSNSINYCVHPCCVQVKLYILQHQPCFHCLAQKDILANLENTPSTFCQIQGTLICSTTESRDGISINWCKLGQYFGIALLEKEIPSSRHIWSYGRWARTL